MDKYSKNTRNALYVIAVVALAICFLIPSKRIPQMIALKFFFMVLAGTFAYLGAILCEPDVSKEEAEARQISNAYWAKRYKEQSLSSKIITEACKALVGPFVSLYCMKVVSTVVVDPPYNPLYAATFGIAGTIGILCIALWVGNFWDQCKRYKTGIAYYNAHLAGKDKPEEKVSEEKVEPEEKKDPATTDLNGNQIDEEKKDEETKDKESD